MAQLTQYKEGKLCDADCILDLLPVLFGEFHVDQGQTNHAQRVDLQATSRDDVDYPAGVGGMQPQQAKLRYLLRCKNDRALKLAVAL